PIALAVLYLLVHLVRSPFGHVLVAIRENQLRATFQGYPVERYKLAVFVISAVVTGLAGALLGFQNYLVSAEAGSAPLAGEVLALGVGRCIANLLGACRGGVPPLGGVLLYEILCGSCAWRAVLRLVS